MFVIDGQRRAPRMKKIRDATKNPKMDKPRHKLVAHAGVRKSCIRCIQDTRHFKVG